MLLPHCLSKIGSKLPPHPSHPVFPLLICCCIYPQVAIPLFGPILAIWSPHVNLSHPLMPWTCFLYAFFSVSYYFNTYSLLTLFLLMLASHCPCQILSYLLFISYHNSSGFFPTVLWSHLTPKRSLNCTLLCCWSESFVNPSANKVE